MHESTRTLSFRRRQFLLAIGALFAAHHTRRAYAADDTVPIDLQVKLTAKVADYDRNMSERSGSTVLILLLASRGDAESERAVARLRSALSHVKRVANKPHETSVLYYESAAGVAQVCRERRAAIVYIAPGLEGHLKAISEALSGVSVLSIGVAPSAVSQGVVLGYKLVSGKPKMLVNLPQARRQHVDFSASLLKLAEVIR